MRRGRRGVTLAVWVVPGAGADELAGVVDGRVKVRLRAPAREGAANRALLAFLAGRLGVRPADLRLAHGAGGRRKLVEIDGLHETEVRRRLGID